jgi:hypothetical protein
MIATMRIERHLPCSDPAPKSNPSEDGMTPKRVEENAPKSSGKTADLDTHWVRELLWEMRIVRGRHGTGLRTMRERLAELDGTRRIVSNTMGAAVRERWPKEKSQEISADKRAEFSEANGARRNQARCDSKIAPTPATA